MIKILIFSLTLFTLSRSFSNITFAEDALPSENFTPATSSTGNAITMDKIKQLATKHYEGKVIAITSPKNKNYFLVSILKNNGKVESIKMDKTSGDILKK